MKLSYKQSTHTCNTPIKPLIILSSRNLKKTPAVGCIVEFEDVLSEIPNVTLQMVNNDLQAGFDYIIIGLSIYQIADILSSIKIPSSSSVFAYIFDAFAPEELKKPRWKRTRLFSLYRELSRISHVFVPFRHSVKHFQAFLDLPISYIPLAADVKKYGGYSDHKFIDVNGYGRQPKELTDKLSACFNRPEAGRLFFHTNHAQISQIHDFHQHRRLFWKILKGSKIALVFDVMSTPEIRQFPFSFVPQRMYESAAAGCTIVGKRPTCHEMDELFDWTNAFIEIPDKPDDMVDFLEDLLDTHDLHSTGKRNYEQTMQRHDWRHRINDIITIINDQHI